MLGMHHANFMTTRADFSTVLAFASSKALCRRLFQSGFQKRSSAFNCCLLRSFPYSLLLRIFWIILHIIPSMLEQCCGCILLCVLDLLHRQLFASHSIVFATRLVSCVPSSPREPLHATQQIFKSCIPSGITCLQATAREVTGAIDKRHHHSFVVSI